MITYKSYVKYATFSCQEEVDDWFNDSNTIYSNRADFIEAVKHLNSYKDKVKRNYGQNPDKKVYTNIWAHGLTVMIPYEFYDFDNAKKFIDQYMIQVSSYYKKKNYLYCYKFVKRGKGMYAEIICWTRKIYDVPKTEYECYKKDFWWNPVTKKMAKKNSENAVLLHRAGDLKLDYDGNKIEKKIYVSPVEKEIFKYTGKFFYLTRWLRSVVNDVRLSLIRTVDKLADTYKKFISLVPRKENATKFYIARKYLKNSLINDINLILLHTQNAMFNGKYLDGEPWIDKKGQRHLGLNGNLHKFNNLIYRVNKIIHSENVMWQKNDVEDLSIYLGARQSFVSYREELTKLKEYILFLINKFCREVFDYEIFY